jgi:hypothetical protein
MSIPQRFGSSLNAHYHFHGLALDGVFSEDEGSGEVHFHEATGARRRTGSMRVALPWFPDR